MNCSRLFWIWTVVGSSITVLPVVGQQNRTLYLQHDVPQSSLLNPAVPLSCGWTIGLPVLASVHANFGTNFATFNKLFTHSGNGVYTTNLYGAEKYFHHNNFLSAELHVQLLEIGYRHNDWSIMLTAIEKSNSLANVPLDLFSLVLHGNSAFEGEWVSLNRAAVYANYYTELGLSLARETAQGVHWGVRGKLLFGKANISTRKSKPGLTTNNNTFDLEAQGTLEVRTSLPVWMNVDNNRPDGFVRDESIGALDFLTETGNPGLAFDFGVIVPLSDLVNVSASVTDVGFIAWRKNLHGYSAGGHFVYEGPLNDSINTQDYLGELIDAVSDSVRLTANNAKYNAFLPTKLAVGISYRVLPSFSVGAMSDLQFYRKKWISGININGGYEPVNNIKILASWSYQYHTLKNVGAGLVLGKSPLQFFAFSDNVLGFFDPANTRNVNVRAGLNILLGCRNGIESEGAVGPSNSRRVALSGNCAWVKQPPKKRKRH